jgi:hypothetical protein
MTALELGAVFQLVGGFVGIGALALGAVRVRRAVRDHRMSVGSSLRLGSGDWQREVEAVRSDLLNEAKRIDENAWRIVRLIKEVTAGPVVTACVGIALWMVGVAIQTWG